MYDAIIIGSGPGGYYCAEKIAELGGKSVVIEEDKIGGTCTNIGCIPTKAMHASAHLVSDIGEASRFGITVSSLKVDFKKLMERKDRIVSMMSRGVQKILVDGKVEIIAGTGKIKDKNTVIVNDKEIKGKNIVIATGAKPIVFPGVEINNFVMTSKELLSLEKLPKSLIIIGGGYIGCEFASIFAALGTKVTIVELMDRIVSIEDEDISTELTNTMTRAGIEILTNTKFEKVSGKKVMVTGSDGEKELSADKVLFAVGVKSNLDIEELDAIKIKYDKGIKVNDKMQTNVSSIYAVGDVTEGIKLAHYAYAQAEVAAHNIMGKKMVFDQTVVPSCIFTLPEIASVGVRNSKMKSVSFPFAANGKARSMNKPRGFVKIYYEKGYLKGFAAIGPHVSDMVSEATLAIKNNLKLEDIKNT
ncbi:dihydrolipoyl dehydrogenase, partial [archaeon]|nr:dihydrolipoyl dehydrogenase [archaeon]